MPHLVQAAADASPSPAASASPAVTAAAKEEAVTTHHVAVIGGRRLAYTATAGTLVLHDAKDKQTASVFYVSYTAGGRRSRERPLTFLYNGGPGASSALIDLLGLGPRIVKTPEAKAAPPAPYAMIDNPHSLLAVSDLVFVDAVGTGFSRIVGSGNAKDFYGVAEDGRAFTQFIRRYIARNDRWNSPKYLLGESYGTTRSAVVAKQLQDAGISLNGIVLLGTVLNLETIAPQPGNDLPYWLFLPTEAAVAAYYHKTAPQTDIQTFLQSVRAFAAGPYATALAKGQALPASDRDAIAAQLHAITGISGDYFVRSRLRVAPDAFREQLLGDEERSIGRYDARFWQFDIDPVASTAEGDPASDAFFGAVTAAFNSYVHDELGFHTDGHYILLSNSVNEQWRWSSGREWDAAAANVSGDLRDAMTQNPYLRVFCGNGLYDMATPFFGMEYTMQHLGLNPALQPHIRYGYYPSGHMVYAPPAAAALERDLAAFYRETSTSR